jgi:hypothetical protein
VLLSQTHSPFILHALKTARLSLHLRLDVHLYLYLHLHLHLIVPSSSSSLSCFYFLSDIETFRAVTILIITTIRNSAQVGEVIIEIQRETGGFWVRNVPQVSIGECGTFFKAVVSRWRRVH